jgi:crotonobetainyl-CoA:carnitine CoA-transferase CaiB-like acyl-CoA transferase
MERENEKNTALGDVRVLDLTGPMGGYCTKLLADLGADVVIVEPPEGHPARRMGPFFHDEVHQEKSLYFFHFNTNKRSVTLNLETIDGRDILKKLVKATDMMIETFKPGYLDSIGLGYATLKEINPRLILISISGFGQTGPYKDFNASDLIGLAMSGVLHSVGFPEDPPTSLACSQAYHMTSTYAAVGALMALYNRDITGEGQWIDIPMQGAVLRMSEFGAHQYWMTKTVRERSGVEFYRGVRDFFPCKDGAVFCSALGGSGAPIMLEWMESEGMVADLRDEKYQEAINMIATGGAPMGKGSQQKIKFDGSLGKVEHVDTKTALRHVEETWAAFLMAHTREELFVGAQTRGVRLMAVREAKDIVNNASLNFRNWFVDVAHPELGTSVKYPGAPYGLFETPWRISRRAPLLGEHNMEIYEKELGLTSKQHAVLKAANVI